MSSNNITYEGKDLEAMSFAQKYHRWIADAFYPYLGKRVAEVGAGSGDFSTLLLSSGIEQLVCVEPSEEMYPLLYEKHSNETRAVFHKALFSGLLDRYKNHFDSVIYINVLEHVEKDIDELRHTHRSLKAGGYVCIFVPALPALYSEFDASVGHYRRYTKTYLEHILEQSGFEIERLSYFDIVGVIPWFVFFKLLRKKQLNPGYIRVYDNIIVPFSRIFESIVRVPTGKNLIAVARKI